MAVQNYHKGPALQPATAGRTAGAALRALPAKIESVKAGLAAQAKARQQSKAREKSKK